MSPAVWFCYQTVLWLWHVQYTPVRLEVWWYRMQCGMWCCVSGWGALDNSKDYNAVILKDYNAVIFRVRPGSFQLLDCEFEGTVILQDVSNFSPNNMAPHPRWPKSHYIYIISLDLNQDFVFFRCMEQTSLEWRIAWSICYRKGAFGVCGEEMGWMLWRLLQSLL